MSGNRSAGRYLLAIAAGELQAGAVVFVASFEQISQAGFTLNWWGWMTFPVFIILGISGFVIYRFRETRALTLAQFFELRYGKSFRLFTGALGFLAGICNFGIIPAIGARCLVYFWGIPDSLHLVGLTVPTYIPLMGLFLSISLCVALSGGAITVIITNCIEGITSQLFYLIIIATLVYMFSWSQISTVMTDQPRGQSLINPFDTSQIKDFNIWYVLMGLVGMVYGTMAWQNSSAYNSAPLSAHEGRMGGVLSRWREMGKGAVVTLLGVCAVTYLKHPDFAAQAVPVMDEVHRIADPHIQSQMTGTIALSHLLPVGVKGIVCSLFLMGIFGGDATHLHSWGTIFVQDVLVPLRKKPFGPKQHIFVLRVAIVGVACFAFLFGSLFRQTEYIFMWWGITMAIYISGAGSAIIGGLYWKKGTNAGAWSAMIVGSLFAVSGIIIRQIYGTSFPLNPAQISFFSWILSIATYISVSLLTHHEDYNLDRLLHRGTYAQITALVGEMPVKPQGRVWLGKLIGLDEGYTRCDKWIAGSLFACSMLFFFILVFGSIWNLMAPWSLSTWSRFWEVIGIGWPTFMAAVTGVWFTWGGFKDIRSLVARLNREKVNFLDDGTVVDHQNLDELQLETEAKRPEHPSDEVREPIASTKDQ